jgi:DNA-binding SARP family transcriptional activator
MGLKPRLLGPVAAWAGDRKIDLGPRKQRLVFAVLALEASRSRWRGWWI